MEPNESNNPDEDSLDSFESLSDDSPNKRISPKAKEIISPIKEPEEQSNTLGILNLKTNYLERRASVKIDINIEDNKIDDNDMNLKKYNPPILKRKSSDSMDKPLVKMVMPNNITTITNINHTNTMTGDSSNRNKQRKGSMVRRNHEELLKQEKLKSSQELQYVTTSNLSQNEQTYNMKPITIIDTPEKPQTNNIPLNMPLIYPEHKFFNEIMTEITNEKDNLIEDNKTDNNKDNDEGELPHKVITSLQQYQNNGDMDEISDDEFQSADSDFDVALEEIDGIDKDDLQKSFLKQMLIETNKHYIKDHENIEDKLKNCAASVIGNILIQKVKFIDLFTFMKIHNERKNVNKKQPGMMYKCYIKYIDLIQKRVLMKYFNRYKMKIMNGLTPSKRIIQVIEGITFTKENIDDARTISRLIIRKITGLMDKNKEEKNKEKNKTLNRDKTTELKKDIVINENKVIEDKKDEDTKENKTLIEDFNKDNNAKIEAVVTDLEKTKPINKEGFTVVDFVTEIQESASTTDSTFVNIKNTEYSIPNAPDISSTSEIPGIFGIANNQSIPGVPGIPGFPGIPSFPSMMTQIPNHFDNYPHPLKDKNIRKLQWTVLKPINIQPKFWASNLSSQKIIIDYNSLDNLFCESKGEVKEKIIATPSNNALKMIKILDDKRLMNFSITLSKITLTKEEIRLSLESFDKEHKFNEEIIDKLITVYPQKDEITQIQDYKGDPNLLAVPEQFCQMLISIENPDSMKRLTLLRFKQNIGKESTEIIQKLKILNECLNSINTSEQFCKVLYIILYIGNYLNHNTTNGNALGFQLSTLNKLDSVKSFTKDKSTLLDFLVSNIKTKDPSLLNFHKEFIKIDEALQIDNNELELQIRDIEKTIEKIKGEKSNTNNEVYLEFLNELENTTIVKSTQITTMEDMLKKEIEETQLKFGEEKSKFKLGDFLKGINEFVLKYKNCVMISSQLEAKNLKKQLHEDKKKEKYQKELNKIRQTVTRKTIARKTVIKKDLKDIKEYIKNETRINTTSNTSSINPSMTNNFPKQVINPFAFNTQNKVRVTNFRINKATIEEENDTDNIDNDFLMINQPVRIGNIQSMSNLTKNCFLRGNRGMGSNQSRPVLNQPQQRESRNSGYIHK